MRLVLSVLLIMCSGSIVLANSLNCVSTFSGDTKQLSFNSMAIVESLLELNGKEEIFASQFPTDMTCAQNTAVNLTQILLKSLNKPLIKNIDKEVDRLTINTEGHTIEEIIQIVKKELKSKFSKSQYTIDSNVVNLGYDQKSSDIVSKISLENFSSIHSKARKSLSLDVAVVAGFYKGEYANSHVVLVLGGSADGKSLQILDPFNPRSITLFELGDTTVNMNNMSSPSLKLFYRGAINSRQAEYYRNIESKVIAVISVKIMP